MPHYVDFDHPVLQRWKARFGPEVNFIDVSQSSKSVIQQIAQSKCVLSSSLHGLVVADSFGIPNRWMIVSDKVLGKGFKFSDYYSAFDVDPSPLRISENTSVSQLDSCVRCLEPDVVESVKRQIYGVYEEYCAIMKAGD